MLIAMRNGFIAGGRFVMPTTFPELAAAVQKFGSDRDRARAALVNPASPVVIPDTWTAENGTVYDDPIRVVDVDFMLDANGVQHLYAIGQRVYATLRSIQFDNREQEVAAEATAQAGLYYYGWTVAAHDQTRAYATAECCIHDGGLYRASAAIAANTAWDATKWGLQGNLVNGAISACDETTTYAANDLCLKTDAFGSLCLHKCTTAGTGSSAVFSRLPVDMAVSQITRLTTLAAGDSIPYSSHLIIFRNSLNDSSKNVLRYGHNNYGTSAQGQYLDSDAAVGEGWATKQHVGQLAPDNLAVYRGYKAGCSAALLAVAHEVRVPYWPNYVTDGPNNDSTATNKTATFWLPSANQMLCNVQGNEGTPFRYWANAVLAAMDAAGCTVRKFAARSAFPATGEAATVYFAEDTCLFYYWNSGAATPTYAVANNDDRSVVALAYAATKGCISATRIQRSVSNKTTAATCRCRSAYRNNSYIAWLATTTGTVSNTVASLGFAGVPACAIR